MQPEVEEMYECLNKKLKPLQQKWMKWFEPIFGPPPAKLPPLHEVNHTILLIDPNARYSTCTPQSQRGMRPISCWCHALIMHWT